MNTAPTYVVHQGDALAVLASLPTASIDALITDPPYSSGGMVRGDRTQSTQQKYVMGNSASGNELASFTGDNRDQRAYAYWSALWLSEALRVIRPGGIAAIFTDWRQLPATTDALQSGGWVWRGIVPWWKPSHRPMLGRYTNACEYVVWGSAGSLGLGEGRPSVPGFYQGSPPRDREHQTQKPLDVMRHLIQLVPAGGTVLDPFTGSGTTGVAAALEGRSFVGVELTDHYAGIASARISAAYEQRRHDAPANQGDLFDTPA